MLVNLSGAENITSHDEKVMPTFTSGKYYYISVDLLHGTADAELHNP